MLETVGIMLGIGLGLFGSLFSVIQFLSQKKKDRLFFLAQIIIDKTIPRESRQPFYDEYIALGGNGTFIKFWLRENKK
ncbi:MAG: hypothetical protein LBH44_10960 [Treponema sp.]|jgi:hypothetical protein|nr:hypothetical protein [Treponema sp.]